MERIYPPRENKDLPVVQLYAPTSIDQMIRSRDAIVGRTVEDFLDYHKNIDRVSYIVGRDYLIKRAMVLLDNYLNRVVPTILLDGKGLVKFYSFPEGVYFHLSQVRHNPDEEKSAKKDRLTIYDNSGFCEVLLPDTNQKKGMKAVGWDFDPKKIKGESWCSDIYLLAQYYSYKPDTYILKHVSNRYASERQEEPANAFLKLFLPQIPHSNA